ncbi:MAG: XisI protein [Planctomycetaceae bacterium]
MDRMTRYRKLIEDHITRIVELVNRQYKTDEGDGIAHCVFDEERDHYLLVKSGWTKGRRSKGTTLFVRLRDGKIHVEEDWTEDGIANALIATGVPDEDIVLAFQSPWLREQAAHAVTDAPR